MLSDKLESNELNFLVIILKLVVFAFSEIVLDVFIFSSFPSCFWASSIVKISSVLNQNLFTKFWINDFLVFWLSKLFKREV